MVPFLWLYGADGVGKSTVAWEIYMRVISAGTRAAFTDFDAIGHLQPDRPEDPYNHRLRAANLGAMWQNFHAAGATRIITSGVVETREIAEMYRAAIPGATLTLCRLRASPSSLRQRIMYRGRLRGLGTEGARTGLDLDHLNGLIDFSTRYAEELDRDDIADLRIDTDDLDVPTVAQRVLTAAADWAYLAGRITPPEGN